MKLSEYLGLTYTKTLKLNFGGGNLNYIETKYFNRLINNITNKTLYNIHIPIKTIPLSSIFLIDLQHPTKPDETLNILTIKHNNVTFYKEQLKLVPNTLVKQYHHIVEIRQDKDFRTQYRRTHTEIMIKAGNSTKAKLRHQEIQPDWTDPYTIKNYLVGKSSSVDVFKIANHSIYGTLTQPTGIYFNA